MLDIPTFYLFIIGGAIFNMIVTIFILKSKSYKTKYFSIEGWIYITGVIGVFSGAFLYNAIY